MNCKKTKVLKYFLLSLWIIISSNFVLAQGAVTVRLPLNVQGLPGTSVTVPVTVENLGALGVSSGGVRFYSANPTIAIIDDVLPAGLTAGISLTKNDAFKASGDYRVSWANATEITGSTTLMNVVVRFLSPGTTALSTIDPNTLQQRLLLENLNGTIPTVVIAGSATVPSVSISIPTDLTGAIGPVQIPINATLFANVAAYRFTLQYDNRILNITSATTTGTLSASQNAVFGVPVISGNITTITVNWANTSNISGASAPPLLYLNATLLSRGTSALTFTSFTMEPLIGAATNPATVNGNITVANTPPVFNTIPNVSGNENELVNFTVSATDANSDVLTYTVNTTTLPVGYTFVNGVFNWTPGYSDAGIYTVQFTVNDGNGGIVTSNVVTITIANTNRAPTLNLNPPSPYNVNGGQLLQIGLIGADPDGNSLTYSYTSTPVMTGATLNSSTGAFSWTPTSNEDRTFNVTFTVSDGTLSVNTAAVITVSSVNVAPSLSLSPASPFNVFATQTLNIQLTGIDANVGDILTYSFTSSPTITGATINSSTGAFTWTPNLAQKGSYVFTFKVTDSGGLFATSVGVININNAAPTLTLNPSGPSFSVNEGSLLTIQLMGADVNVGDALTYSYSSIPTATGATINSSTGAFSWTPGPNQSGTYNITFSVFDGTVSSTVAAVITVVSVNVAPTLTLNPASPFSINEGSSLNIQLLGSDLNSGSTLTYSYASTPAATGATLNPSTGAFNWIPATNQFGTYNVTFTVSDGSLSANVTAVITVVKVNIAPTLTLNPAGPFNVNENSQLNIQLVGADLNSGTTLTYLYNAIPAATGASLNSSTGLFSWTPGYDQAGVYNVTFTVFDGVYSTNVNAIITVADVNLAPVFTLPASNTFTIAEAATSGNTVIFEASGTPGVTYSMIPNTPPLAWAAFNSVTATLTLTPHYGVAGAATGGIYTFTIRATGSNGLYTDKVITVTVTPTLRPPSWTGSGTTTIATKSIKYNEKFNFNYTATDIDGHTITYSLESVTPSTTAAVFTHISGLGGFGQLVFTPTANESGKVYIITIKATCSAGLFSTTTTVLSVGVNTPPEFTSLLTDRTVKVHNVPVPFTFQYVATDIDGDLFTYTLVSGKGSISSTGFYSWTPIAEDLGTTNTVKVRITDAVNPLIYTETTAVLTCESTITGVENGKGIVTNYALMQNYPNPFNPSTTIQFGIPTTSNVKISVFNILGEEVAVLVNRMMNADNYKITFDASNLPSGLYLYRIQADNYTQVRKMILAK